MFKLVRRHGDESDKLGRNNPGSYELSQGYTLGGISSLAQFISGQYLNIIHGLNDFSTERLF